MKEPIKRLLEEPEHPEEQYTKTTHISYDGRQYLVRIPNKITEHLHIKKTDKLQFTLNTSIVEKTKRKIMVVEVIEKKG